MIFRLTRALTVYYVRTWSDHPVLFPFDNNACHARLGTPVGDLSGSCGVDRYYD